MGKVEISLESAALVTRVDVAIAALMEAANCLAGADAPEIFVAALDNNHHLWRRLVEIAPKAGWRLPEKRLRDFVLAASSNNSRRVLDSDVESLIQFNCDVAAEYGSDRNVDKILCDVEFAWKNSGAALGLSFQAWLLAELG
ncbi:MAG: hypothetical protein H7Z12_14710 [Rhodospirillaceae bacterium]|nr:hypothetical protein [Rhodospirillales bacterium]